jgi:hypothetical protein
LIGGDICFCGLHWFGDAAREIDRMIRQAQSLLPVILFGMRDGKRRLLRGFERPHVDGVQGKLRHVRPRGDARGNSPNRVW